MRTLELQRICGDACHIVIVKNGVVEDAFFISTAPVRGFEKLVRGKSPLFAVQAVMRVCGICHAAHAIASCEAFEDALGISPPLNARLLREAIGLANRVQSHIFHLILLLEDLVGRDKARSLLPSIIRLLNDASDILSGLGGAPTHPPVIVVGGVEKLPPASRVGELRKKIAGLLESYRGFEEKLLIEAKEKINAMSSLKLSFKMLATHAYYGDKCLINTRWIRILRYREYRGEGIPEGLEEPTGLVALYMGDPVEVGPRARLCIHRGYRNDSLWGIQEARMLEIKQSLERIIEILEQLDHEKPYRTRDLVFRSGRGVGVYEAPRGTLVHETELDDEGRVVNYRIIVPTMFLVPIIEAASRGVPEEIAGIVPRVYDPCIPCVTHTVRIEHGGRKC